jgi:TorA maturation chaperone TorD
MTANYERALARSRAYALLSHLYLRGLTPEILPQVASIDEFCATLPVDYHADQAAAAYQQLFGRNVFPYQSVFLDPAFLLGGAESSQVAERYAEAGYPVDAAASEPDHIGYEIGLLAFLCGAEADALADGQARAARHARRLQQTFLDEHLLWWLPVFVQAVCNQQDAFYAAVAAMTQALVVAHRQEIDDGRSSDAPLPSSRLPVCPDPLDAPDAGLQEIAAFLATPACAGVYLSRADIARLARACDLPCGFGDRRQMLTNFLRAAAEFDSVAAATGALLAAAAEDATAYAGYAAHGAPFAAIGRGWLGRVATLRTMLARIAAAQPADPLLGTPT